MSQATTRAEVSIDTATFLAMVAIVVVVLLLSAVLFRSPEDHHSAPRTDPAARKDTPHA